MSDSYSIYPNFHVAVDCIIFGFDKGELHLLLQKRNFQPALGEWSLMGGFVNAGESTDEAAKRVLTDLTGLSKIYMEQVGAFGEVERDPGERVVSIAYYALLNIRDYDSEQLRVHNACWIKMSDIPDLIFDHNAMVARALETMKGKASHIPISFNLLPEYFTLTQLQSLYEAIYGEPLDKRNFRKKVAEMDYIEKTDHMDKTSSKRGAILYRFNDSAYRKTMKFRLFKMSDASIV